MLPHQERVVEELSQLNDNIEKLSTFMHGDIYPSMPATDQGLLMVQIRAMKLYSETLAERVSRF